MVAIFTVTISILSLVTAVSFCIWLLKGVNTEPEFDNFKEIATDIIAGFSGILLAYLLFSFVGLRRELHQIFGKNLSEDFKKIKRNFLIMVVIYGLFTVYNIIFGNFYRIICKMHIRWILNGFFYTACESGIILSIMHLYHSQKSQNRSTARTSIQPTEISQKSQNRSTTRSSKQPSDDSRYSISTHNSKKLDDGDDLMTIEDQVYEPEYLTNFELY